MTTKLAFNQIDGMAVNVRDFGAVGDGVTDDTAALNAAFASGGEVHLAPALTYLISGEVAIPSNTTIYGSGAKIKYSGMPTGQGPGYYGLWADASENIKVFNLEVDGNKSAYSACDAWGIYFRNCDNVEVANCHIHDCWRIGIGAGQVATGQTTNGWFHHNYIYNIGDSGDGTQYGNGVAILHAKDIIIESNIVDNIYGTAGINLEGDTYSDIKIVNNTVMNGTGSNLRGIMQYESGADIHDNILISGNTVINLPAAGITFSGNGSRIITGNVVRDCGEEGIKNYTATASDVTISNNQVFNCGADGYAGINIASSLNLVATNNLVSECPAGSTIGMTFTATQSAEISGNSVNDCQTNAYELGCVNFTFTNNKANNIGAVGSGSNYFLKNRATFVCTDGVIDNSVLVQGAGTASGMFFFNGANWLRTEFGKARCDTSVTKFVYSAATGCSISGVHASNSPDAAGNIGTLAAWELGDRLWDSTPATGAVGFVCTVAGTPGTWTAY